MRSVHRHSLPLLFALLAVLAFGSAGLAQKKPRKPPPNPVQQAAKEQVKLNEAELLREAYILLAAANHNYEGHRVKAMNEIQAAVKILDTSVLKKGTAAQKAATLIEDNAAARAKIIAKHLPKVNVSQVQSDALLRVAAALLLKVEPVLAANGQKKVLVHVEKAGREIVAALKSR
jgi:hypothetical protein